MANTDHASAKELSSESLAPLPVRFKSEALRSRLFALSCVMLWLITLNLALPTLKAKLDRANPSANTEERR